MMRRPSVAVEMLTQLEICFSQQEWSYADRRPRFVPKMEQSKSLFNIRKLHFDSNKAAYNDSILISKCAAPSPWFIATLVALVFLQIPAITGQFLQNFAIDEVTGWLGQFVLLILFIDAVRGVLSRVIVLFPLIFYLCYYFAFEEQGVHIALKSNEPCLSG
jgi:hypothetical protein